MIPVRRRAQGRHVKTCHVKFICTCNIKHKKHLLFLSIVLLLFSCGEYLKVLKSSDVDYKYKKAIEYYEKEDFARAMPLFRELTTMLRATKKSEEVMYYLAYCHYNNSDFITSSYLFKNYVSTFPNGSHLEECFFMGAYCVYLESPSFSLDATYTQKAIGELQEYINKYPEGSIIEGVITNQNEYALYVKLGEYDIDGFLHANDLSYTNKPDEELMAKSGMGLAEGCKQSNCTLSGGETAILPELVHGFDIAGTSVGYVKQDKIIDGTKIAEGNVLIGLKSSGPHSNGYTLIRKLFDGDKDLGKKLVEPTRIYVKEVMELINQVNVNGIAHITGGGLDNISRINDNFQYVIDNPLPVPSVFDWLQKKGMIDINEMEQISYNFIL